MQRYLSKISGPLLDRIDIHVEVTQFLLKSWVTVKGEQSIHIRERVTQARLFTDQTVSGPRKYITMPKWGKTDSEFLPIDETSKNLLKQAMERLNLSARAYDRILKVARTIADLRVWSTLQAIIFPKPFNTEA